jgi:hypothetical protein
MLKIALLYRQRGDEAKKEEERLFLRKEPIIMLRKRTAVHGKETNETGLSSNSSLTGGRFMNKMEVPIRNMPDSLSGSASIFTIS